jgi:formylmethanofuran dehydrogenase subunit E
MQCDVHKDKVAVGFCEACGRMICRDCAVAKGGKLLCREDAAKLEQEATATVPARRQ